MSSPRSTSRQNFLGSIRGRFVSIVGLFVLALIAMVAALTWMDAGDIYDGRRNELKAVIEVAYKTVEQEYNEFKSGKISEAEAQERAKASLRAMRYNATDYVFAMDKNVFTIVHGARPDQEGRDHSQEHDPTGKYMSREMRDAAFAKGEAYVDYQYPKPGASFDQPSPKLAYVRLYAPWEWVLGTGMYVDDVVATIWRRILVNALSALAFLAVIGGAIAAMMFRMSKRINLLNAAMTRLAAGERDVTLQAPAGNDEIGDMARAVEIFKENAIERARLEAETAANRSTSEAERERDAARRAQAAEEQAEVVRRLSAGLKDLADGDLMARLGDGFSPAYAQVRDDFNQTIDKLKQTIVAVVASAGAIRSAANEISVASDDLSHRTEQQAANLEETAATLSEVTATVKNSAEGASHARQVVASADEDAKKSALVVREAVDAMSAIAKSSQQISQIIGVIDEIAFQTNLLALNAGVEAARAGDAGKGFAVVASEVRALAQRSAEAAKEIKGLISDSTAQVDAGVKLVAETGKSLERIMTQVVEINAVVADIAAGSREQSTALQEINAAIEQMNLVTQQNSAMVVESTAAGHSLSEESGKLAQLLSRFRTGHTADEETVRRELRKVAPHVLSAPAKAASPAPSQPRAAAKAAAASAA